ncbi:MAG TPA: acyl-CoA dehydrogenase family protein [Polyangiaceae bacterium]|nr:acyl-CoA dehydrogenase family protein [Polyangiaceae bacterium]
MHFSEPERAIKDQFRRFMTAELEPRTAAFEAGTELPYALMKKMIGELGLAMGADAIERGTPRAERSGEDSEMRRFMRFAETELMIEMCRVNPGYALSFGASVGLFGRNVAERGTPEQAKRWVPAVLRGEKIGCWCLTEPGAGSDALGAMQTTARRKGDAFVLNGSKTFITNAPHADYFLVYAKNDDGLVQAFLVERGAPGLSTSKPFAKMGMKTSPTGAVYLEDVHVPAENLLGGGIGDRDHVRKSLSSERIGLAAMSYGIAERCFEIAVAYAKTRVQGGRPIAEHQLVAARLARMYVGLSNARRIVYASARGEPMSALEASAGKLYIAEVGTSVALDAIHVLGGNGYMDEYVVERLARDAKLVEIGGGTTEIQLLTIARHVLA